MNRHRQSQEEGNETQRRLAKCGENQSSLTGDQDLSCSLPERWATCSLVAMVSRFLPKLAALVTVLSFLCGPHPRTSAFLVRQEPTRTPTHRGRGMIEMRPWLQPVRPRRSRRQPKTGSRPRCASSCRRSPRWMRQPGAGVSAAPPGSGHGLSEALEGARLRQVGQERHTSRPQEQGTVGVRGSRKVVCRATPTGCDGQAGQGARDVMDRPDKQPTLLQPCQLLLTVGNIYDLGCV